QVNSVVVNLPDLDQHVADRIAPGVEDAPAEVRDLTDRGCNAIIDDDEVVVGIERQVVGIKRPVRLTRRERELFGEEAAKQDRRAERRGSESPAATKKAAGTGLRDFIPGNVA